MFKLPPPKSFKIIEKASLNINEIAFINKLRQKDLSALDQLYSYYSAALYGVIKRILRQDEVAEEVLQDVFMRVWNKIDTYKPEKGRLFTWMLNVARNMAIDKSRSKEINKETKTISLENFVNTGNASEQIEPSTESIGLSEHLNLLPEEQKFVVEQLYLRGYTQSEMAEEFNIPLGTIKTRLRLAMIQLRSIYNVS